MSKQSNSIIRVSEEVRDTLASGGAVVALESTIFSNLGLPSPANAQALDRCIDAIRSAGAVPAITAVIDGVPRVGLQVHEHERILGKAQKAGEREIALAVAQGWAVGATTVSASLLLAAQAGIGVFATGGIGGVHRDSHLHGDISADLGALAAHPVVTVCAGAKSFLDLPRTLEYLETLGVPVVGVACDEFPAFTVHSSGLPKCAEAMLRDVLHLMIAARDDANVRGNRNNQVVEHVVVGFFVCQPFGNAGASWLGHTNCCRRVARHVDDANIARMFAGERECQCGADHCCTAATFNRPAHDHVCPHCSGDSAVARYCNVYA